MRLRESESSIDRYSPSFLHIRVLIFLQRPQFTVRQLADFFRVSPEAISRILKSKWRPSPREQEDREKRWNRRNQRIAEARKERRDFREQSTALHRHRNSLKLASKNQSTTREYRKHSGASRHQSLQRGVKKFRPTRHGSTVKETGHEKRGNRHSKR